MSEDTDTPDDRAARHISQIRFHQQFTLKQNSEHGRPEPLRVTYSDLDYRNHVSTNQNGESIPPADFQGGPVLFFIGGMYGTRYMATGSIDALARKNRIRVILADKFGLGGTGDVPLEWRVKCFIDLVEGLLEHLKIKHVSMASHSAGTIYILNAVLELRHLLHPKNPFVCLLSPWVHPSRSGELQALNLVPDAVLGQWDKIAWVVEGNVNPALSYGASTITSIRNWWNATPQPKRIRVVDEDETDYDPKMEYGTRERPGEALQSLVMNCIFNENARGGTDEAFLCLKRGPNATWGCFEDFDEAIAQIFTAETKLMFEKAEEEKEREHESAPGALPSLDWTIDQEGKLRVKLFFAESDYFIGKKGREWMESLWRQPGSELRGNIIYDSTVIEGSDHDTICDVRFGVIDQLFAAVRLLWIS